MKMYHQLTISLKTITRPRANFPLIAPPTQAFPMVQELPEGQIHPSASGMILRSSRSVLHLPNLVLGLPHQHHSSRDLSAHMGRSRCFQSRRRNQRLDFQLRAAAHDFWCPMDPARTVLCQWRSPTLRSSSSLIWASSATFSTPRKCGFLHRPLVHAAWFLEKRQ